MPGNLHLSAEQIDACFASPMQDVTTTAEPAADIWDYAHHLDLDALGVAGLDEVQHVYRDALGRFDQVLIGTERPNIFLVVVVDRGARVVLGHRRLDLDEIYGRPVG